ncbi:MAG: phosphoenolpyruvate--protein phosphotransferase [Planctomycetes bacterium]|nr:phosphoenolpyruvate--protein phosphotransferase [Planctomycetota bacterium]
MEIRKGIPVSAGYAIAHALVLGDEQYSIPRKIVNDAEVAGEVERLRHAKAAAAEQMRAQVARMPRRIAAVTGKILESHIAMLGDQELHRELEEDIRRNKHSAEYAVTRILNHKIKLLAETPFAQRFMEDFRAIEDALLRQLTGERREDGTKLRQKAVIVAKALTPAQTAMLDRGNVLGLITETGGRTSHTAIVASSLGIPAVVGVEEIASDVTTGDLLVLDGSTGTVITDPDEATLKRYQAMERNFQVMGQRLSRELRDLPAVTKDGTRVSIFANIEMPDEIPAALDHGAEGIGLYRTEFLFHKSSPTEKDHLEAYRKAVSLLGKRPLIIRTLDLGADKMPADGLPREENPFLGTRAVRLCFERPEVFKTQLRALLKVAEMGNVSVMIPMISSIDEIFKVREIVEQVRAELRREGETTSRRVPLGIMIEVPSAAITADQIAPHVDFFSVGTNDLIAYTIAVDRTNERVAALYQPAHPAILRLLQTVIEAGMRHGRDVSVCGEMSSDLTYTLLLLGMGLRTFSVVPPQIPEIKKVIRSVTLAEAKEVAAKAVALGDAIKTTEYLRGETRKILPDAV